MKLSKRLIAFTAVSVSCVVLVVSILLLMTDNSLNNAAKASDTITIDASYNEKTHTLTASQRIDYNNRSGTKLGEIKFHIYANAYRDGAKYPPITLSDVPKAYPNGKNFGNISIQSVTADGEAVKVLIEGEDDTVLSVPLAEKLEPGQSVHIGIEYTVKLAKIKHRLGWTDKAVNLGNFYPVPCIFEQDAWQTYPYSFNGDPFYNALHNFEVSITAPEAFTVAASGTLAKVEQENGMKTTHLESKAIRDFAVVLSKEFKTVTKFASKTAVNYYYIDDPNPHGSLETAVKSLATFSKLFTAYPYKQLAVVQTDFLHGGMEYGELVYISRDVTEPEDYKRVIIHEIAHQWWYGMIGNNQTRTAWIDEGLAEYSTLLFFDQNPEYKVDRAKVINNARNNYTMYVKLINSVNGVIDSNMDRDLNSFNSSYEYVYMTYVRGLLLFCDLEQIISKPRILTALRDFASHAKFTIATPKRLIESFENSTKVKLGLFFDSYIKGSDAA